MKLISGLALTIALSTGGFYAPPVQALESFPSCKSEKVLRKVVRRFNQTEKIYWIDRGLVLDQISGPHNHTTNPFPESPINRHYCHGDAHFNNGKSHRIHYLIEKGAGFAGFTWNVEYCIHGLDPWRYYDGRCRVLSRGE
ncbi:MAG: hypothetical protein ACR2O3_05840 [Rhizobiaceae bacterium]